MSKGDGVNEYKTNWNRNQLTQKLVCRINFQRRSFEKISGSGRKVMIFYVKLSDRLRKQQ